MVIQSKKFSWGGFLKIKDKSISLLGIIFPNIIGNLSAIIYVFTITFIKLKNNFLSKKFLTINTTTLTLSYVTLHAVVAFLFNGLSLNAEFKGLVFLALTSIIISSNKRFKNLNEIKSLINLIIFYLSLVALFVLITRGFIFRFPDFNPIRYGFNSTYVGSLFVIIFGIFKDKFIRIKSAIIILLAGSGTAISGFILYLGISNFSNFRKSRFSILKLIFILFLVSIAVLVFIYTQSNRGRNLADLETIDRYLLQSYFIEYYIKEFTLTKFLFGTTFKGSLLPLTEYIDIDYVKNIIIRRVKDGFVGANMLHNEHLRIIFHFGFIGYAIFQRQIYLLVDRNKILYTTIFWMQLFNPIIYINSTYVLLIFLSNFKLNRSK